MNARQHLVAERRELLALCRSLGPGEWEAPSLCESWRVRDVVAHIIGAERDRGNYLAARFDLDAANARSVERRREVPVQQLLADLAEIVPARGVARLFAGLFVVDNWIHQEDIRRPLGRPRAHDPERLRWVLRWARVVPYSRAKNVRLVATDLSLALGRGPEVRGPAAELIMAATGRRLPVTELGAAHGLEGPGLARLVG